MSVAIRTITRLQDADDAPALGAGQDGYALTWDNASGAFVATALSAGVTDHGALTGLTDDDHTQYALLAGRAGGQTLYGGTNANDDIIIHGTSNATRTTSYVLLQPTAGYVGIANSAPSKTLEVGGPLYHAAIRVKQTDGDTPSYFGQLFTNITYVSHNLTYDGANWNRDNTGALGALYDLGAAETFRFRATAAGSNPAVLTTVMTVGTAAVYFAPPVGIGTTSPGSLLHGLLTSAATNAVTNVLTIGHDTSGMAANGFGAGQLFALESSTTAAQSAARIQALWNDATHATRKADLVLTAYDTAEREGLRIRGNGSAAAIGFLGAAPAARIAHVADPSGGATVDAEARSAINSILATLETFGFHATS